MAPPNRVKLTTKALEKLTTPGDVLRDSVVRGLFAERGKKGVSLKIQAELRRGQRTGEARERELIRMTLGQYPDVSLDAARAEAMRLLSEIKAGRDPRPKAPTPAAAGAGVWTVQRLFDEYGKDLAAREKSERTRDDLLAKLPYFADWASMAKERELTERFNQHLAALKEKGQAPPPHALDDWRPMSVDSITKEMARYRHECIADWIGPSVANKALKALKTCIRFANKARSETVPNPVDAVTFRTERSANRCIAPDDLPGWYARLQTVPNPLRRVMHETELFLGLRPSNTVGMMRAWINFTRHVVIFPAPVMKNRQEFHLPLSEYAEDLLQRALVLSREFDAECPWVFPTRSRDGKRVIATPTWKEDVLPSETGHMLRHTYSNIAKLEGIDEVDRELLLAHTVPGVKGTYLFKPVLFGRLLEEQKKVTRRLLETLNRKPKEVTQPQTAPAETQRLLTREGLMEALAISDDELTTLTREGIPALSLPSGPRYLFEDVVMWLRHREEPSRVQVSPPQLVN